MFHLKPRTCSVGPIASSGRIRFDGVAKVCGGGGTRKIPKIFIYASASKEKHGWRIPRTDPCCLAGTLSVSVRPSAEVNTLDFPLKMTFPLGPWRNDER